MLNRIAGKIRVLVLKIRYKEYFRLTEDDNLKDRVGDLAYQLELQKKQIILLKKDLIHAGNVNEQLTREKSQLESIVAVRKTEIEELTAVVSRNYQRLLAETAIFNSQINKSKPLGD